MSLISGLSSKVARKAPSRAPCTRGLPRQRGLSHQHRWGALQEAGCALLQHPPSRHAHAWTQGRMLPNIPCPAREQPVHSASAAC